MLFIHTEGVWSKYKSSHIILALQFTAPTPSTYTTHEIKYLLGWVDVMINDPSSDGFKSTTHSLEMSLLITVAPILK